VLRRSCISRRKKPYFADSKVRNKRIFPNFEKKQKAKYLPCPKTPSFLAFNGVKIAKPQNLAGTVEGRILICQVEQVTLAIQDAQQLTVLIA